MKILIKCIIFLFIISFLQASLAEEIDLEALYDKNLYTAPASARLKFQNETGLSWYDVSLKSRHDFLLTWEESRKAAIKAIAEQNKKRAEFEKSIASAEKDRALRNKAIARKEAERLKALADEKKARDKQIEEMKKQRARLLKELRLKQKARTSRHK